MKKRQNFQIFIISRFLVMLILVVMSEFLVFFAIDYALEAGMGKYPILQYLVTLLAFIGPVAGAAYWFSNIVLEEVQRMDEQEEQIRKQYERARNLMLSDIAHDLRTPITTIAGYSKALHDGMVTSEEKKQEYLEAIENKSERMSELITLLFEYVKMDSENYSLKLKTVDLTEILRKNAALVYSDVEEKKMTFEIEIPEEPVMLKMDELQFSRAIVNLIQNALKHNQPGTEIALEMKEEQENIVISITDDGEFIDPLIVEHIFEPFVVADASRESNGGNGLGLSIAKRILEMHGWGLELVQDYERQKKSFIINIHK